MAASPELTIFTRALRGSGVVILGFGGTQAIRFGSNLILTRLLFPEAFGLMAIVAVVLAGLGMFSDIGIGPSIMRSPRGDEPLFLDTAWALQIVRGIALWIFTFLIAVPLGNFYNEPSLIWLLPFAGVSVLFESLRSTRLETENRHLRMNRVTVVELWAQVVGVAVGVTLAAIFREAWALPAASVMTSAARCCLSWTYVPGHSNRFRFERAAASELVGFGKWIFLSTIAGFFAFHSDKLIIGAFLPIGSLGIYNIGFFLGSFAILAAGMVCGRLLIPLYREVARCSDASARLKLARLRMLFTALMLIPLSALAILGVPLVGVLFDPRFAQAGIVAALLSCVQIFQIIVVTYDQAALAAGDSRNFFFVTLIRAILQVLGLIAGASLADVAGAIAGQAIAAILGYLPVALLARHHNVYDPRHDLFFGLLGVVVTAVALTVNAQYFPALLAM